MIEKMKVVHIVAAASEKTALLDRLRTLGIVHFAEKASADQRHLERFAQLSRMDMALQEYAGPGRETAPITHVLLLRFQLQNKFFRKDVIFMKEGIFFCHFF